MNPYLYSLKKRASGLGFFVFSIVIAYIVAPVILYYIGDFNGLGFEDYPFLMLVSVLTSFIGMFLIGILYCKMSDAPVSEVVPLKKTGFSMIIRLVLIGVAVSFISDFLTDIILVNFSVFGIENQIEQDMSTNGPVESILYIIEVAIFPPLVEEFAFRGVILNRLRPYGDSVALITTSVLFGLVHGNIVQIPFAFVVGLALGFAAIKSGSIIPGIIIHFVVNFSSVMTSVLTDNGILTDSQINIIYYIFVALVIGGGILSAVSLSRKKDFWKIGSAPVPFKTCMKTVFTSAGMIVAILALIGETIYSVIPS